MSIFDDTGQSPSITEGTRSLRLFTDRYHLIRVFTRALHEDDALGKILFLRGGGGNGKSLLIRFLQQYACKRFFDWDRLSRQPDAEFVRRLQQNNPSFHTTFHPLPVAHIDFHAPPREFEQPTVDYDAILMLRRQLGNFRAESLARLRFPVYDFAAVWYLHQTGRLTEERLSSLFPHEEINFVIALAEIIKDRPVVRVAQAVLGLFDQHLGERWTLFRRRRGVDRAEIKAIQAMDPERDLVPEMPRLFAMDLNAALTTPGAPPRIILLADGHEVFSGPNGDSGMEGDRDRWLRYLLGSLQLQAGIVPVITSRQEPYWADRARYAIPSRYLDPRPVGHFSDADARTYLAKASVDDSGLRARLCDYARIAPNEIHPLYAGLGADIVLQGLQQGRRLTVEDFPDRVPDAQKKPQLLVERLLREASRDVGYAVRSLAAARAFDRELFEKLGSWGRSRYSATDAAFDTLTQFSFVWEAETRGTGWYSIHALLQRILRERGHDRLREADGALEAIYLERAEAGDPFALAEVVYHAYQQEPERGLQGWVDTFEEATIHSRYALCEALRSVGAEFQPKEPQWRARMALQEGQYLLDRYRYAEADEALQRSVLTYNEALSRAPDDPQLHNNKGNALRSRGDLLAGLARYEEAEHAYAEAGEAFDKALGRVPDYTLAHNYKGNALARLGELLAGLARNEEAEEAYRDAVASYEEALSRAPDDPQLRNNKGNALGSRGDLLAGLARYEEAEEAYAHVIAAFDEALNRAPDHIEARNNKGTVLASRADLLTRLARYEEAEEAYADSIAAFDEVLSHAPDGPYLHNNKGIVLTRLGELLTDLARYEKAEEAYEDAVASYDEALGRAPDYMDALHNKGNALMSRGDLLTRLARYEEAEGAYGDAIAAFDEVLSRASDHIEARNNKGNALARRGELLANLLRYEEAEVAYADAVASYDEALSHAPDGLQLYNNKGNALTRLGELLTDLARYEAAEEAYEDAVASYDEALSRAPDHIEALHNKGNALMSRGDLLTRLARYEEAEGAYGDAIASCDEALSYAPYDPHLHINKGNALGGRGDLLTRLARNEEAEEAYADAIVAYDKALNHAPDYTYAYNNKAHALARRGELLAILSRYEEAEKAYADGAEAFDETLSRAPGGFGAHYHKAMALFAWGVSMRSFVPAEVTRDRWEAAQTHCEHALTLAPQPEQAEQLLASIILHLDSLDADTSQE